MNNRLYVKILTNIVGSANIQVFVLVTGPGDSSPHFPTIPTMTRLEKFNIWQL